MDNVTHTLFALTLARTPLGRAGRGAVAALVLASNAPDIDIVTALGGTEAYLKWHRGPTHGPLGILGLGVVVAAAVHFAMKVWRRAEAETPAASFRMLCAVAVIGVFGHVLMDVPTSYGTRFLAPFDWHWFAVDWMPIIDVYLLFALAAGLLFGQASQDARRRNAAIVLALMAANYGMRGIAHREAIALTPRLFGPALPQPCEPHTTRGSILDYWPRPMAATPRQPGRRCLVEVSAVPMFFSPFGWRVIAHLSNAYEMHDVNLLDARWSRSPDSSEVAWRTTQRIPNVWTPQVVAAASTALAQNFLGFSRLPAARSLVDASGIATVRLNDMRFLGTRFAGGQTRTDPFAVIVRVAPDGRVLDEQLGP
jgi:membrane-bound metal-dependent hydrolase YbcI (DUF457 family)